MATPKKKHLIELMIEAGVKWPDGAEYAAQDKYDLCVKFYNEGMPNRIPSYEWWNNENREQLTHSSHELPSLCRNWHQTIVTREQYAEALDATIVTPSAQVEAQPAPEYCASVMRQMPDNTIEQLTSDYHAKASEADRLQVVADEALKAADDALLALEKAGELIGLIISIDTKPKQVEQPTEPVQPEITDWRDLRVGDVVECVRYGDERDGMWPGGWARMNVETEQVISGFDVGSGKIKIKGGKDSGHAFRFIRRP